MLRIATPFAAFMAGLAEWWAGVWLYAAAMTAVVIVALAVTVIVRHRQRVRYREPQYRRRTRE